jgi:ubiquinone biosynthesis protein UbiJ
MPATPAWLASVEALLNRSISQSTRAAAEARRLNGTSLRIDIEGMLCLRVAVADDKLALSADGDCPGDAGISGSPLALLGLRAGRVNLADRGAARDRGAVQISGDAEIAERYRELFSLARPDWEEELSRLVGDVPARLVSRFATGALSWARQTGRTARQNLVEYLQEESRDLVSRPELDEFFLEVDQVRETADRVEARLRRLEQRLKGSA